jgi:glycosyltransferase involved in cell wall biosynthesis
VYPEDQAGTRLRAHQFVPHLLEHGVETRFWSFLSLEDSRRWFGGAGRTVRIAVLLRSLLRLLRLPSALRRADAVLVLREALPIASAFVERAAARRAPVVWDVDDAVWTEYPRLFLRWVPKRLRLSSVKYEELARLSTEVWAGSEVLAQWCRHHSASVHVVPTVLDVAAAPVTTGEAGTVAWVGSASTAEFLEGVLPALAGEQPPVVVDVVGATGVRDGGVEVRQRPWTEEAERDALRSARVGLYPIDLAHPLGPGKAGLKAVLYMAHGIPCVVSPTPTLQSLVEDGVQGLHAGSLDEWRHAVRRLRTDDALWARMSAAGRARALEHFSLQAWGPWVARRTAALTGAP